MTNLIENGLKIEILKYENESDQFVAVSELVEYVPEDGEFELYEYVTEDTEKEAETTINIKNKQQKKFSVLKENDQNDFTTEKTITIKLEKDSHFHRPQDNIFRCSNLLCKKNNIFFGTIGELDKHNEEIHIEQISSNMCPICNKVLASQKKLSVHMDTRHIPRSFSCDHCGKVFRSKDNLRLHMSHHRKHFVVECRACKKTYKSMQSLRYHLRQHFEHFQCEECGAVFEHKKLLTGHIVAKHNQELMVQCRYCTRMFSRNDVREAHERDIHKNGEIGSHFKCNECESAFDFRDELMKHKIQNHYSGQIHTCKLCEKSFKKSSLLKLHMNCHLEKSIQCSDCLMMFTFVTGLAKHKKLGRCKGPKKEPTKDTLSKEDIARIAKQQLLEITVNPSLKTEVEVDIFGDMNEDNSEKLPVVQVMKLKKKPGRKRKVVVEDNLENELKSDEEKTSAIVVRNLTPSEIEAQTKAGTIQVSSSGRIIKRKLPMIMPSSSFKLVNIPKRVNVPFVCDHCGAKILMKNRLISHLNNHLRGKKHICRSCDRTFSNIVSLKKHCSMMHRDMNPFKEKRFQCDQCPKRYLTEFLLGQHKLSHENLKNQRCHLCDFATNVQYDLKNHIKRIHHATRDYVCPVDKCGKAFKRRCDMQNHHKTVHSTIKIYVKCPTCDVIVLEKGLQSHIINRHSEKAKMKPFVCNICGKAERYEKNLQRHYEAVHDPKDRGVIYACNECPQTFFRRRELKAHSFDHFEGVIHQCEECGNKYKTKKELTNHLYSHRCKEWPCSMCEAVFQTKSGLCKHERKHYDDIQLNTLNSAENYDQEVLLD